MRTLRIEYVVKVPDDVKNDALAETLWRAVVDVFDEIDGTVLENSINEEENEEDDDE